MMYLRMSAILGLTATFGVASSISAGNLFLTKPSFNDCTAPEGLYYLRPQFTWRGEFFRHASRERAKAYFDNLLKPVPTTFFDKILHSDIQEIKPCGVEGIDALYVINLAQRPEKWATTKSQLDAWGLHATHFDAILGKSISPDHLQQVGMVFRRAMTKMPARRFSDSGLPIDEPISPGPFRWILHRMPLGAVGCLLSHLSIMQHAYNSGFQRVWIMEDDIHILRDPREMCDRIAELDRLVGASGWDVLYSDRDMLNNDTGEYMPYFGYVVRPDLLLYNDYRVRDQISEHLMRCGARWGCHSLIVNRPGLHKILWFYKMFGAFTPIDTDIHYIPSIREYCVMPDVVTNLPFSAHDTANSL